MENRNGKDLDYSKHQKKTAPVFSIDDDQELGTFYVTRESLFAIIYMHVHVNLYNVDMTMTNNESEEPVEVVSIQQWMKDPKLLHSFKCQEVKVNGDLCDRYTLRWNISYID